MRRGLVALPHGYGQSYPDGTGGRIVDGPRLNLITARRLRPDRRHAVPQERRRPLGAGRRREAEAAKRRRRGFARSQRRIERGMSRRAHTTSGANPMTTERQPEVSMTDRRSHLRDLAGQRGEEERHHSGVDVASCPTHSDDLRRRRRPMGRRPGSGGRAHDRGPGHAEFFGPTATAKPIPRIRSTRSPCNRRTTKPVISVVHGITYTIGIEMMLAGDIVIAADTARFCQLESKRGIAPLGGAHFRYLTRTGWGNAMYHLFLCDEFARRRRCARVRARGPSVRQAPRARDGDRRQHLQMRAPRACARRRRRR